MCTSKIVGFRAFINRCFLVEFYVFCFQLLIYFDIQTLQFPLLSRSGVMERLIAESSEGEEEGCVIKLPEIPGGAKTFELVAKFCYGVKLELTSSNVVYLLMCCRTS